MSTTAPSGLRKIPMLNKYDHSGIICRIGLGGILVGICHTQIGTSVQMGKLESVQSGLLCTALPAIPCTSNCLLLLCHSPKHTWTYGNLWQRTPWQLLCSPRTPVGGFLHLGHSELFCCTHIGECLLHTHTHTYYALSPLHSLQGSQRILPSYTLLWVLLSLPHIHIMVDETDDPQHIF